MSQLELELFFIKQKLFYTDNGKFVETHETDEK